MSSVRYGTRFGDLKENWFLLFSKVQSPIKHSTHTQSTARSRRHGTGMYRYADYTERVHVVLSREGARPVSER